jgi:hypothetical protein
MTWMKFSVLLVPGFVLAGLQPTAVLSQDKPAAKAQSDDWDRGPVSGGQAGRPKPPRDVQGGPGGRPDDGGGPRRPPRDRPGPPDGPDGPQGGPGRPQGPGGPDGERRGPPPGFPPRGHEGFESLKTTDPELYTAINEDRNLDRQACDQAELYRHAGKDERAKIKEKLTEIVGKHFEARQKLRILEVKRLEQQLTQLREKIDQREKSRKEIVDKRILQLTSPDPEDRF